MKRTLLAAFLVGITQGWAAPGNDHFAQAELMPARPELVSGSTAGATWEAGEINHPYGSVWYQWTPSESSGWEVSFVNTGTFDTVVVFTGTSLQNLIQTGHASAGGSHSIWVDGGGTYYLRVEGVNGGNPFSMRFVPGPVNDLFSGRLRLPSWEGSYVASMVGASMEPGEPDRQGLNGRSLWWEWIAPQTGAYYVAQASEQFGPLVSIFQGSSVTNLTDIPKQLVSGVPGGQSAHTLFRATEGQTYLLRITALAFQSGAISFSLRRGPLNDDWGYAEGIGALDEVIHGDTTGVTYQPGEANLAEDGGGTIWYWWDVPATGTYIARAVSVSSGVGRIGVYRGTSVSNLVPIHQGQPTQGTGGERLSGFRALAGERVFVSVHSSGSSRGPFALSIVKPVMNDDFAQAEGLQGLLVYSEWRRFLSTVEPNESSYGSQVNAGSLWWRWIAPRTGGFLVRSEHDPKPVGLGIYAGTSLATLTRIAGQTNAGGDGYVGFCAEAGREYFIHLAQDYSTSDPVRVILEPGADNDLIADASQLFLTASGSVSYRLATMETDEPLLFPGKGTLWWKWSAPAAGTYTFSAQSTLGEGSEIEVAAFSGGSRPELQLVGRASRRDDAASITLRVAQGDAYYFVVAERPNLGASLAQIHYLLAAAPGNDDFVNAMAVTNEVNLISATTRGATREAGEPDHRGNVFGRSVWFKWVAPFSGKVLAGVDVQWVTGRAYRGTNLQNLEALPNGDISTQNAALDVVADTQYYFALESPENLLVDFRFRLGVAPANDHYANRQVIDQLDRTYRSWTVFAGHENREAQSPFLSVWWTWTAPQDGVVTLETESSDPAVWTEIYYQEPLLGQQPFHDLSILSLSSSNRAAVVAGRQYDIRMSTRVGASNVSLTLRFAPELAAPTWSDTSFLRGGTSLWIEQTNEFHSPPSAMQPRFQTKFESIWMQKTFMGSGRLSFWWKRTQQTADFFSVEALPLPGQSSFTVAQTPSIGWTRVEVSLHHGTNVVRWMARSFSASTTTGPLPIYVDDIVFIPNALRFSEPTRNGDGSIDLRLTVGSVGEAHGWQFESSADLMTWVTWTNRFVDSTGLSAPYELGVKYHPAPGEPQRFFRVKR